MRDFNRHRDLLFDFPLMPLITELTTSAHKYQTSQNATNDNTKGQAAVL